MKKLIFISIFSLLYAIEHQPLVKASAALKAGMYKEALRHVTDAQKDAPTNSDVYRMQGLLHEAIDEPEQALRAWKRCLKFSKTQEMKNEANIHIQSLSEGL
jgi:Flp pilus assembly protein TadD|tara:strand:+ start:428 stop:733 length:306 start_codon:yes stop_codon:yes gene_type:complete